MKNKNKYEIFTAATTVELLSVRRCIVEQLYTLIDGLYISMTDFFAHSV